MSSVVAGATGHAVLRAPKVASGSTFFGLMAGGWGAFVALATASPTTLDDAYDWLRGLALFWEALGWILTLPWTVAYLVLGSAWTHWARVLVVVAIAVLHLVASAPRTRS